MKNYKKMIACLIICSLILFSSLSFLTIKTSATDSKEVKEDFKLSNFKKIVSIPVSEEGIEYTGSAGRSGPEGPNAFDVKGDKVYVLDNVHHRVLIYSKTNGNLIDKIFFPENYWIYNMAVDKVGKIYLFDAGLNSLITILNGQVEVKSLERQVYLEPLSDFGVSEDGPYVVISDERGIKTVILKDKKINNFIPDSNGTKTLTIAEEKKNNMSYDKIVWKLNWENGKVIGGQISTLTGKIIRFEFPSGFEQGTNRYIGMSGNIVYWKLENKDGISIVGFDSESGKIERAVQIPLDIYYIIPQRPIVIDEGNVYVLVPSEKSVDVLTVTSWQSSEEFIKNTEKYKNKNIPNDTVVQSEKSVEKYFSSITNSSISRSQIISTAQNYQWHQWYCNKENYDGSKVANPNWWKRPCFIKSYNTSYYQVPYCWGGFSSLTGFDSEISQGYAAGNVDTSPQHGYVGGTAGVDCSGFVSRCWGLASHHSTTQLKSVSISLGNVGDYSLLKQGDILLTSNHVMLYYTRNANNEYVVYESTTGGYDRVICRGHTYTNLVNNKYEPWRYKYVTD